MGAWSDYLQTLSQEQKKALLQVLEAAEKYIPQAERVISYQIPTLKQNGKSVIAAAAWKNHIGIYPFGSKAVENIKPLLKNASMSKGTVQFRYDDPPTEQQIKAIVEARLALL